MSSGEHGPATLRGKWAGGFFLGLILSAYYWLYFLPPRAMGERDPDRYYHLALSKLMAGQGLLRSLPQAEDMGWGNYFPDTAFLFHVLTAACQWLGGAGLVLALVPMLGLTIALVLYFELARRLRPLAAAAVLAGVFLLTPAFLFRLTLLGPQLLAILCFSILLVALLREKPRTAALAALLFALSFHAFYMVVLLASAAWLFRNAEGLRASRLWLWTLVGLVVGTILNPYFPSNLSMSLLHLGLALGADSLPSAGRGMELQSLDGLKLFLAYGFVPVSVVSTAIAVWTRRLPPGPALNRFWFLALVSAGFWILGAKSPRAMEYAMPACILMLGYGASLLPWRAWLPLQAALLVAIQGYVAKVHYEWYWQPGRSVYAEYSPVIAQIPAAAKGRKVFNCEWWAGAFILMDRPDLRFVVMLEPTFLWQASHQKFEVMQGLLKGEFEDPHLILRGVFKADYVLCADPELIRQMEGIPSDFVSLPGTEHDRIRLFAVRPGLGPAVRFNTPSAPAPILAPAEESRGAASPVPSSSPLPPVE